MNRKNTTSLLGTYWKLDINNSCIPVLNITGKILCGVWFFFFLLPRFLSKCIWKTHFAFGEKEGYRYKIKCPLPCACEVRPGLPHARLSQLQGPHHKAWLGGSGRPWEGITFSTTYQSFGKTKKYICDLSTRVETAMSDAMVSLENLILHAHLYMDFNHTVHGPTSV